MIVYILSLIVGLLVGGLYALFGVRSPAPPVVALIGMLGILLGEQGASLVKARFVTRPAVRADRDSSPRQEAKSNSAAALRDA